MSSGLQPAQAVSASKHALTVSEILIYIFNEAKPAALVAAARVNRQWSEHALDRLWRNLESVVPLLEILAPLARSTVQGRSVAEWNLPERIVSDRW
ncbi:hypothetical protein FRC03_000650 [Tulasnella sp. 419]|nr:hypothetical protein FRC03_000650 [Tulasnella sp. 419]